MSTPDPSPDPSPDSQGRPVFFVRPHSVLQETLITELIRNEYEVAVLEDHTKVALLIRNHPEAIVFFNIDEGYSPEGWASLVRELRKGWATQAYRLGVLTYNDNPELARRYLIDYEIEAGFIKLSLGVAESTKTILRVLEANEAKGRRQALRVLCRDNTAQFTLKYNGEVFQGTLLDISAVTFTGLVTGIPPVPPRTLIKKVQLKFHGTLSPATALVIGSRLQPDGREALYMLLDPKATPEETFDRIRWYQRKTLQANLDDLMAHDT